MSSRGEPPASLSGLGNRASRIGQCLKGPDPEGARWYRTRNGCPRVFTIQGRCAGSSRWGRAHYRHRQMVGRRFDSDPGRLPAFTGVQCEGAHRSFKPFRDGFESLHPHQFRRCSQMVRPRSAKAVFSVRIRVASLGPASGRHQISFLVGWPIGKAADC